MIINFFSIIVVTKLTLFYYLNKIKVSDSELLFKLLSRITIYMQIFKLLKNRIEQDSKVMLLLVVESKGSSPGRQGFKMGVGVDGEIFGSIGGGIMEYNLVEEAKSLLHIPKFKPFVKKQIHKGKIVDGSGMICSGEQSILFYILKKSDLPIVNKICNEKKGVFQITQNKIEFLPIHKIRSKYFYEHENEYKWTYLEKINFKNKLFIIGAGHVGLATSEIFSKLDFEITLIDDRKDLNTFINNSYINHKIITNYIDIDKYIPEGDEIFITIMTQSFKTDKIVLEKILYKKVKYVGILGSKAKLKTMFEVLENDGISKNILKKVYAPIGLPIHSKTPMEIAVSISSQIIKIKNEVT